MDFILVAFQVAFSSKKHLALWTLIISNLQVSEIDVGHLRRVRLKQLVAVGTSVTSGTLVKFSDVLIKFVLKSLLLATDWATKRLDLEVNHVHVKLQLVLVGEVFSAVAALVFLIQAVLEVDVISQLAPEGEFLVAEIASEFF